MAGASLAAEVAPHASVLLLEMEGQPGFHATGRSVAFWSESYGGPAIQPLTTASGPLLRTPDPAFSSEPFLHERGAIHIGTASSAEAFSGFENAFSASGIELIRLDRDVLEGRIGGLRSEWTQGIAEPSTTDIDVAALLAAYMRAARKAGAELVSNRKLLSARRDGDGWRIETSQGSVAAGVLVNAAGAWADDVARACGVAPVRIQPLRRTVLQLRIDPSVSPELPLIIDIEGRFYFKGEGSGRLWLSPHDETPSAPCDAAPEELAVAEAIARFEEVVDWKIEVVERKWAGLRSFAPDRLPVYGFDPLARGFFWFAGQGGFGIQTAPAAAKLAAALLLNIKPDTRVAHLDPATYDPGRFE